MTPPPGGVILYTETGGDPEEDNKMKYTYKDALENVVKEDQYTMIIDLDGNRIALLRDWGCGTSFGHYFTAKLNGKTVCTRCRAEIGIKKALKVLNEQ